ncbi:hypothetical protein X915_gp156 [Bacillus phage vB_BanS-Tsamsa]|uniref:Uncharacterized protein n=1 Tax=Bacillus phage vB_BanS-Tsamsa TaxID=1308863 RepID=U5J9R7_9CAUD|nr:hypothetical protein X915_gp156 [Bacillus phage vB_BanS-Tsamsa]AGI11901.1 hypothetical protein [Bacillus phage vB_BanS-Tsamsa]
MVYTYSMLFITYAILFLMMSGCMLVSVLIRDLKNENSTSTDEEKLQSEAFLQSFWDTGFFGKVNFVLLHGARFWAIVLGDKFKRKG